MTVVTPAPRSATKFHVAPLQAYTHRHMRNFLRLLSTSAVLWTEMEKASDLLRSDTAFANALEPGATSPIVLQLGGSDPHELGAVATAARGRFAERSRRWWTITSRRRCCEAPSPRGIPR